jgi:hypothetical protein
MEFGICRKFLKDLFAKWSACQLFLDGGSS